MDEKEIFKNRVEMEYQAFCRKLMNKDVDTILKNAPRAEAVNKLHGFLIRASDTWDIQLIRILLMLPSILGFFYRKWKKRGNSGWEGMPQCIREEAGRLLDICTAEEKEESA